MLKLSLLTLLAFPLLAWSATSQEHRADKKYELTLQAGADYRMGTSQLAAMYFIDPNNLVGIKGGSVNGDGEHQTNVAVQYKHFAANSFYVAGEVFYLNSTEDLDWFWRGLLNIEKEYARYTSLGAGVRIGNQWSWENFTLGCDWVGFGRRFGTFHKDTDELSDGTFTLLNLTIGASF